ncbi:hypothetical protein MauCBS54593_005310 [Microsporum audouinii]
MYSFGRSDIYGSQPPAWAPLEHPRLSYSLNHSVGTCSTSGPTHTAVDPLLDPTNLPTYYYEQYVGPPPMTDPYAYRLAAPSENGDGTNTLKTPLFEASRTSVVGLQGRRGDPPNTNLSERTEILITTDGRAQCPQCPKTFVHKKHARRHLLRHTGERPYMCPLCTRAFTRSDVLKDHFQKCSLRRGSNWGQALIPPAGPQA